MRRWLPWIVLAVLPALAAALDPLAFADDAERDRYRALAGELRCLVCQNQSLADSPASLAGDLRRVVLERMREGMTDAEIKTYLAERFGDFVLYSPPLDRRTWWLWFGPGVGVLVALVAVAIVVRRRRQVVGAPLTPVDDDEARDAGQ